MTQIAKKRVTKADIEKIFTSGVCTKQKQTAYRSHGTFTSNSTSWGVYTVKFTNNGLTRDKIRKNQDFIRECVKVPKPSGSIYSSITGATVDDFMAKLTSGNYIVTPEEIIFTDFEYCDTFIGD